MSGLADLLLQGLATSSAAPSQGGLRVADYPNPYGLRAYKLPNGGYGGEMLPKSTGWLGVQRAPNGDSVTEYSIGDDVGDFPSLVPGLNRQELDAIVNTQQVPRSAAIKAQQFADRRRAQGKSPFYDPFLEELSRLTK